MLPCSPALLSAIMISRLVEQEQTQWHGIYFYIFQCNHRIVLTCCDFSATCQKFQCNHRKYNYFIEVQYIQLTSSIKQLKCLVKSLVRQCVKTMDLLFIRFTKIPCLGDGLQVIVDIEFFWNWSYTEISIRSQSE